MEELGIKQVDIVRHTKASRGSVSQWLSGVSAPSVKYASKLADYLQCDYDWLMFGAGTPEIKSESKPKGDIGEVIDMQLWSKNDPLPEDEFAYLPFYKDVEFQGGKGCFPTEDFNGYKLAFAKSTLHRYNVSPKDAVMVSMTGDSMEPVIPPGSTIGINMGEKRIMDGKIYAIDHGGLLRIKRLYRLPNGYVRINSYNDIDYKDECVPIEEIEVVGKIFTWQVMV
ncbi:S24 family peptidase [Suttonella ornithocola]|nr:helix-turn-helix transcriptional regulator [Suttonella ornithocola]